MNAATPSLEAITFPAERQRRCAERIVEALAADPRVEALVCTASLALGYADPISDLDMAVYVRPDDVEDVARRCAELNELCGREEDLWVDLDVATGDFRPGSMGWCDVDEFELLIGNFVAYSVPIFDRDGLFARVKERWLPYYEEALAEERAARFALLTANHCHQGRKSVRRDFALDALDRLQLGVRTFVAGLFVARRVYPVDYMKRVDRHLSVYLGEPTLGGELRALFDVGSLESVRMEESFDRLHDLARTYLGAE